MTQSASEKGFALKGKMLPGPEAINLFHAQFSLLINIKLPTIAGVFIFISRDISCSAIFSKKEFEIFSNLRFICRKNFMLS